MSAEIIRQIQDLKALINDDSKDQSDQVDIRFKLQNCYRKLLVTDLELSLDEKIEQDLWNLVFKKHITKLQLESKDKFNQRKSEVQSKLLILLHGAFGFYNHLLSELCSIHKLDLTLRPKASKCGILKEYPSQIKSKSAKKTSCLYICQDCLVHLGDLARYRQQNDQANLYYRLAASILPFNGQPYNQLAILEAQRGNKLATVFLHIRSICIKHPFTAATTNLDKFYLKISRENNDLRPDATANEVILAFLHLQSMFYLKYEMTKMKQKFDQLISVFPSILTDDKWDLRGSSGQQLVQIFAICIYTLREETKTKRSISDKQQQNRTGFMLHVTVSLFDQLIHAIITTKEPNSSLLQVIKVVLDWLKLDLVILNHPITIKTINWNNLAVFFNLVSSYLEETNLVPTYKELIHPLPEEFILQQFLPIYRAYREIDFSETESLSEEMENYIRNERVLNSGKTLVGVLNKPKLLSVDIQNGKCNFLSKQKTNGPTVRQNVAIEAIMKKGRHPPNIKNESANSDNQHIPIAVETSPNNNEVASETRDAPTETIVESFSIPKQKSIEKIKQLWDTDAIFDQNNIYSTATDCVDSNLNYGARSSSGDLKAPELWHSDNVFCAPPIIRDDRSDSDLYDRWNNFSANQISDLARMDDRSLQHYPTPLYRPEYGRVIGQNVGDKPRETGSLIGSNAGVQTLPFHASQPPTGIFKQQEQLLRTPSGDRLVNRAGHVGQDLRFPPVQERPTFSYFNDSRARHNHLNSFGATAMTSGDGSVAGSRMNMIPGHVNTYNLFGQMPWQFDMSKNLGVLNARPSNRLNNVNLNKPFASEVISDLPIDIKSPSFMPNNWDAGSTPLEKLLQLQRSQKD